MTEPKVRYYLGANTPGGFYSLYDQLLDPEEMEEVLILKGGPGCGKSTLMGRVATRAEAMGLPVEYIRCSGDPDSLDAILLPDRHAAIVDGTAPHVLEPRLAGAVDMGLPVEYIRCSGDPDSLDAILLPDRHAAIVDGTAPHVLEPRLAGAVERYVDLGACYDHVSLKRIRGELEQAMKGYKGCYARAYRCLRAAAELAADRAALLQTPALEEKMRKRARGILSRECRRRGQGEGRVQRRFLSAITHKGVLVEFETVEAQCRRVYELSDHYGLGHLLLAQLLSGATAAGWDAIACPSPLFPERLEHLILPQLSLAFVTTGSGAAYPGRPFRRLRIDAMVERELLQRSRLEHLILPQLSLAFVTTGSGAAYPGRPFRRLRIDAMVERELLQRSRARLHFSQKVSAALLDEAVSSLAQAKAMHDALERLYNPHVDFEQVGATAEVIAGELLGNGSEQGNTESLAQAKAMHDALERLYNPHVDFEQVGATAEVIAGELLGNGSEQGNTETSTEPAEGQEM